MQQAKGVVARIADVKFCICPDQAFQQSVSMHKNCSHDEYNDTFYLLYCDKICSVMVSFSFPREYFNKSISGVFILLTNLHFSASFI